MVKKVSIFIPLIFLMVSSLFGADILGDANNDIAIDIVDALLTAQYYVGLNPVQFVRGNSDVDANNGIDIIDALLIAQRYVGLIGEFPGSGPAHPSLGDYYSAYVNTIVPDNPGYSLPLDTGTITNYSDMDSRFGLSPVNQLISAHGFAVMEYDFAAKDNIFSAYNSLKGSMPTVITPDLFLHLYHILFDYALKEIEETYFFNDIRDLTAVLLDYAQTQYSQNTGDIKEAARRNMAFLAVAGKLINPGTSIPAVVADEVATELANIASHDGFVKSEIFIYDEDYSQYVPRGHYTKSTQLEDYFKTFMWYGRMSFLLKGSDPWGPAADALISPYDAKIQTMQAVLLAGSLEKVTTGSRSGTEIWDRIYAVTAFFVGLADDLTPYEYMKTVNKVFGGTFAITDLANESKFFDLKTELSLLRLPKIFGGTGNIIVIPPITPEKLDDVLDKTRGMRFMGQRFVPDSYIFQQLVSPKASDYTGTGNPVPFSYGTSPAGPQRCYPRGLDVMAVFGSDVAMDILVADGDTDYRDYTKSFNEVKAEFDALSARDWTRNLYWGWLYSLKALLGDPGQGYPAFMRTDAWQKRTLNSVLASWTELRHDTILYAKQSYTPWAGSPPPDVGFVEPVPEFYGRLRSLAQMTREGLTSLNVIPEGMDTKLEYFENLLTRVISISEKELTGEDYSGDFGFIKNIADGIIVKIIEDIEEGDEDAIKTSLVADVHTYSYEELVVEEATGYVDLLLVACPYTDGSVFLAAGPVLSYYEFKHPMDDRLTDEAWRTLLASAQKPDRPSWYKEVMK
ncbi:MAG: DUF3160 domain-containing protein [Spirochaetales bacterium]|nr:DUF3160 domain-containing protein [Spirochaetales bacterium]